MVTNSDCSQCGGAFDLHTERCSSCGCPRHLSRRTPDQRRPSREGATVGERPTRALADRVEQFAAQMRAGAK